MARVVLSAIAVSLLAGVSAAPAAAQAPIMRLSEVQPGMRCTGLSVVRGTQVSLFDVEVVDVIGRDAGAAGRILVRVSGPAVDATGIGPGFSGSPILCPGSDGVARNAGAISEAVGEYGGKVALATPIEAILAEQIQPPPAGDAEPARPPERPGTRPLASPLSLGGVSTPVAAAFRRAAARVGQVLYQAPGRVRQTGPRAALQPGSAMAVGLSTGDVALGAIGTVAYVDGDRVWGFGHPYEGAGRRSLFLQDAFIHTVINNPVASADLSTYKLGSTGEAIGTLSSDGLSAVAGRLGALPSSIPLRVSTRDLDTGRPGSLTARVADETDLGLPGGSSPLSLAGTAAVTQAALTALGAAPARQSGDMCVEVAVRELRRPLRFCNTYVFRGGAPGGAAASLVSDFAAAAVLLDGFDVSPLHVTGVEVGLRLRRGARLARIEDARAPQRVRRGRRVPVRLALRRVGTGARSTRTVRVRIPRDLPAGEQELTITGTPADLGQELDEELLVVFGEEGEGDDGEGPGGPRSLAELRSAFRALGRYDGLTASFREPGEDDASAERRVDRGGALRISGSAQVTIDVRR